MEKNRVFGGRCYESLASYDRESSSWRMSQLSLFEEDAKSLARLPKSGIAQNGQLFPLEIWGPVTSDGDGLQLPTPMAHIVKETGCASDFKRKKLITHFLPTPTASDPDKHPTGGLIRLLEKGVRYSAGDHRNLPTPTAHLAKEAGSPSEYTRKTPTLICHFLPTPTAGGAANGPHTPAEWRRYDKAPTNIGVHVAKKMGLTQETIGQKTRLNPLFVEWMMGFPIGWTDLER